MSRSLFLLPSCSEERLLFLPVMKVTLFAVVEVDVGTGGLLFALKEEENGFEPCFESFEASTEARL